ncbi:hypothetical protein ACFQZC_11415 [Streptacidiphilus monticola]
MKQAAALTAPDGATRSGLLATPQALPFDRVDSGWTRCSIWTRPRPQPPSSSSAPWPRRRTR